MLQVVKLPVDVEASRGSYLRKPIKKTLFARGFRATRLLAVSFWKHRSEAWLFRYGCLPVRCYTAISSDSISLRRPFGARLGLT